MSIPSDDGFDYARSQTKANFRERGGASMTDKTRNSIFQYRLNCNGNTYLMMKIHVVKDRVYLGIEGMVEPYVVIEGYPIELSIVLGPSNTTLIEAIRIVEKKE